MGIRQFKPVTSATRFRSVSDFAEVTKTEPERSLVEPLTKTGGRNNKGHITTRWRGGGHKRQYRRIDFRREKFGVPAKVTAIEALFKVTVTDVRTLVVRLRRRTGGLSTGRAGRRSAWKNAIVTLKEGDAIAVFEG